MRRKAFYCFLSLNLKVRIHLPLRSHLTSDVVIVTQAYRKTSSQVLRKPAIDSKSPTKHQILFLSSNTLNSALLARLQF
jgi:hypothetical protein